jgi:hypothetical protein
MDRAQQLQLFLISQEHDMAIKPEEIQYLLSGGPTNANPLLSLGGAKSTTPVTGLFSDITAAEAAVGISKYRCVYVQNDSAEDLTLEAAVAYFANSVAVANVSFAMALGMSAVNGVEQAVSADSTAPVGPAFAAAASRETGIALGSIPAGQSRALWVRLSVTAGAPSAPPGTKCVLRVDGETVGS